MNVLVTGGAGFVGSHLVEQLCREGETVRVVDNLSTGNPQNLKPFLNQIEFIQGDLLDETVRERAVVGVDVIFHEAAIPSVPRSVKNPVESHLHGAHLTLLLLDAARRHKVRRLIFAGSSSAYGDTVTLPKVESMLPQPLSPYAASKLAAEYYALVFAQCYELDTVVLRYFNVYGPRQDPNSPYSGVIARFCQAFSNQLPITIFGDGEQSRDFTYISNVVQANLRAARTPTRLGGRVLNIGCGERCTLNAMFSLFNELSGQSLKATYKPTREGDVKHSLADIGLARKLIDYQPECLFREGLAKTLEWYKKQSVPNDSAMSGCVDTLKQETMRNGQ